MPAIYPEFQGVEDVPLTLDADQAQYALSELSQLMTGMRLLYQDIDAIQKGTNKERSVSSQFAASVLQGAIFTALGVGKRMGAPVRDPSEEAQLREKLKEANTLIEKHEARLASRVSPIDFREALARVQQLTRLWWREEGLGHVRSIVFDEFAGSMHVTLSCKLSGKNSILESENPVTERLERIQWLQDLSSKGFQPVALSGHSEPVLRDTPQCREALHQMIKHRLPSAVVMETSSRAIFGRALVGYCTQTGATPDQMPTYLSEVVIWVKNIEEVFAVGDLSYASSESSAKV